MFVVSTRRALAMFLVVTTACASSAPPTRSSSAASAWDGVRYRLKLHENPVDAGEAFRCYGRCQQRPTPQAYLACLSECPGFEVTPGAYCAKDEVPPETVCLTARPVHTTEKLDPNVVVVAVIADVLLVVGLATLCASSNSQCGYRVGY